MSRKPKDPLQKCQRTFDFASRSTGTLDFLHHVCVCFCMWGVHTWERCACTCVEMNVEARGWYQVSSWLLSTLYIESRVSHLNPELADSVSLPSQLASGSVEGFQYLQAESLTELLLDRTTHWSKVSRISDKCDLPEILSPGLLLSVGLYIKQHFCISKTLQVTRSLFNGHWLK